MKIELFKDVSKILEKNENFYIVNRSCKIFHFSNYKNWIEMDKKFDVILSDIATKEIKKLFPTLEKAIDYVRNYYTNLVIENIASSIVKNAINFFKEYNIDLNAKYLYRMLEDEKLFLATEESAYQEMKDELEDKEISINNRKERIKDLQKEIECLQTKK